jgi:hypothetical protein
MRVGSVIAAGLCFLAVAAPYGSLAQSPRAKVASRLMYATSKGLYLDPPYKFFGSDRFAVDKIPNPVKWVVGSGTGFGVGAWSCHYTEWWWWCPTPAEAKGP